MSLLRSRCIPEIHMAIQKGTFIRFWIDNGFTTRCGICYFFLLREKILENIVEGVLEVGSKLEDILKESKVNFTPILSQILHC